MTAVGRPPDGCAVRPSREPDPVYNGQVSADPLIDAQARAVLARLEARDAEERQRGTSRAERLRQITPDVGRFLQALVLAARPRSIVEIGTSGGYSTVWIGAAARSLGGSVTTLEIDPAKVRLARTTIDDVGLTATVSIVEGDAFAYLSGSAEPLDFVFLDAEKEDYLAFLELVAPRLKPGGVLVADNLTSHAEDLAEFRDAALSDPRLAAVVVPIGRGELLAVRV